MENNKIVKKLKNKNLIVQFHIDNGTPPVKTNDKYYPLKALLLTRDAISRGGLGLLLHINKSVTMRGISD